MASQCGSSQAFNPYSGLESFEREQAPSPVPSNLIDLNSRKSTVISRPLEGRHALSNSHSNLALAYNASSHQSSLLDDVSDVSINASHTAWAATTLISEATLKTNHDNRQFGTPQPHSSAGTASPTIPPRTVSRRSDLPWYSCGICHRTGQGRSYCNRCGILYCQNCWDNQVVHSVTTSDTHEQTDVRIHEILRASLRPERSESQQKELHRRDQSTTWFGVVREGEIEESTFRDHGRFWKMMKEMSKKGRRNIYPALVSFVGHTGAGKSTLIKVLIDLQYRGDQEPETPVVGSLEARNIPTSGDVHLYADPHTAEQDYPILYADCEGLEGGEILPTGTSFSNMDGTGDHINSGRVDHGSDRRITWATTAERQTRHFAVANLYPRFLYTFSDVVIFVLKNGREFENVAKSLLQWAVAALEKSSNQPVLPHAIIALNESPNELPDWHWNSGNATRRLFEEYRDIIHNNPNFEPYTEFWARHRKRIDSLEILLLQYYSSIRVVNIPSKGRPNLIAQQIGTLYDQLKLCCKESRGAKLSERMLFTADELHPYLVSAFDHFATNLDDPFDFVKFSYANSPIPMDFAGNIVKLAIMATNPRRRNISVVDVFEELSYMVASSIMLDAARHRKLGTAETVFPNYLGYCDDALEDFCDRFWPCEFRNRNGACVNVKAGHKTTKGHQRRDGRVIGKGSYQSKFSTDTFRSRFRDMIYNNLQQLLDRLTKTRDPESQVTEAQDAATLHAKLVLKPFFNHLGGADTFQSNSICLCCLTEFPEHPLPCGHVLCTPCVKSYGLTRGKCLIEMISCPLELNEERFEIRCQIVLKPPTAGVRILTLDGGGIRAVAELEYLRILKQELGGKIPLRALFDLIVGTNAGGMIALDLTLTDERASRDVGKISNKFEEFCEAAFTHGNMLSSVPFVSKPRYHTGPLEMALKQSYTNDHLFGYSTKRAGLQPKVAVVCSLNNLKSIVLSNYNRRNLDDESYIFQRPDNATEEVTIWEAARATITTPTIFRDFRHTASDRVYHGGNSEFNNPVELADVERKLIYPETEYSPPDILISIGAGYDVSSRRPSHSGSNRRPKSRLDHRVLLDPIQSSLDAQHTWEHFYGSLPIKYQSRYIRLNLAVDRPMPKLDDVDEMAAYKREIQKSLRNDSLTSLAQQLIASCFYFKIKQPPTEGENQKLVGTGSIECRFAGINIRRLGEYFNETRNGNNLYFSISEKDSESGPIMRPLSGTLITEMIEEQRFRVDPIEVTVSQKIAIVEISLHFSGSRNFPISGFPRHLQHSETKQMYLQPIRPNRWRPENREANRERWRGPSTTESARPADNLSQYKNPNYRCGQTKLPYARQELYGNATQLLVPYRPVELESRERDSSRIENGQSALSLHNSTNGQSLASLQVQAAYTKTNQARSDSLSTRHRQHRSGPDLQGAPHTSPKSHKLSRASRCLSNEDRMITMQSNNRISSGLEVSQSPSNQLPSTLQLEKHPQQQTRALPVPVANHSSSDERSTTTTLPKPAATSSLAVPQAQTFKPRIAESEQRSVSNSCASSSAQPQQERRQRSEQRSRDISNQSQSSVSPLSQGQSSGGTRDRERSKSRPPSSSQVYPLIPDRRRQRRRSSRSSQERRTRVGD